MPPPTVAGVAPIPAKNAELAAFFDDRRQGRAGAVAAEQGVSRDQGRGLRQMGRISATTQSLAARELGRRHAAELQQRFDRATALARRPAELRPVPLPRTRARKRSSRTATTAMCSTR